MIVVAVLDDIKMPVVNCGGCDVGGCKAGEARTIGGTSGRL